MHLNLHFSFYWWGNSTTGIVSAALALLWKLACKNTDSKELLGEQLWLVYKIKDS